MRKPGNLRISRKDISTGAISLQGKAFSKQKSKTREARVQITFTSADAPTPVKHGLRFVPTGYTVLRRFRATGAPPVFVAPGDVYNDQPLPADFQAIVLKCTLEGTVAEILVR